MSLQQDLAQYIETQQKASYSIVQIRNYLLSLGYDPETIGQAIDSVYHKPSKKLITKKTIGVLVLAIFAIAISTLLLWPSETITTDTIDRQNISNIFQPPTAPETTEPVAQDIFGSEIDQRLAERRQQQADAETEPENRIIPEESQIQEIEFEKLANIIRNQTAENAALMCRLRKLNEKNECFKLLAVYKNNTAWCQEIENVGVRDNCYISFAFSEDFTVCDKIANKYLQLSCRTLGRSAKYDENALLAQPLLLLGNETII